MNDEEFLRLPKLKDGRFDVPADMAFKIADGAITEAKIASGTVTAGRISDDLETRRIAGLAADHMRALMAAQDEYFEQRPVLRFLRRIGVLPDPWMPARLWARKKTGPGPRVG